MNDSTSNNIETEGMNIAVDPRLRDGSVSVEGGIGKSDGREENMIDDLLATMTNGHEGEEDGEGDRDGLLHAIQATLPSSQGNPDAYSFFPGVKGPHPSSQHRGEDGADELDEPHLPMDMEAVMEGEDIAVGPGGSNGGAKRGRRKKKEGVQYDQGLVKGSEEWSRLKKDNHKEVERRRRETINDGINELKKIVPGCDKNKGSILQRAVQYLLQLKENEAQNIEKWTLEKMLNEQSVKDLNGEIERLNKTLEEREGQLRGLRERLKEREEELGRLKGIGAKRLREDEGVEGDEAAKRARV